MVLLNYVVPDVITYVYILYVCRVCPEAGPSLDMHHQGETYVSFLGKGEE